MDFVTLGMFIIDEIHFQDEKPPAIDVLGGAGSWAVLGARIFRQRPTSRTIGWTVHKGKDFPLNVEHRLLSWDTSCNLVDTPHRRTTRGWNKYGNDEERAFKYTTEKLRIDETHLTEPMLRARSFHLICTPTRCINLVNGIMKARSALPLLQESMSEPPLFIWEPVPDSCGPSALQGVKEALEYVDVVSPNHQELAALFHEGEEAASSNAKMMSRCCILREAFGKRHGAVVVRCGERGCYVDSAGFSGFLPAYHQPGAGSRKVIDPTGAGNAFLGAYCVGMLDAKQRNQDLHFLGAVYGSIAAGYAVEQVGMPELRIEDNREYWNGETLESRWSKYAEILRENGSPSIGQMAYSQLPQGDSQ